MLDATMYLFCFASIVHDIIIASIEIFSDIVSSLSVSRLWGRPSHFSFKEHKVMERNFPFVVLHFVIVVWHKWMLCV